MEPDSPFARVERTLWTVWNYITDAVNRILRPQPANIAGNEPNFIQESPVDSKPPDCGLAEGDSSGRRGVDEEQPLATAPLLSSSRPVVAWEPCTTEVDLRLDEESLQYKTQLSNGGESKESEDSEGSREEQCGQTGNDDAGLLVEEDEQDKTEMEGLHSCVQREETPEDDEGEQDVIPTDDAKSEAMEKSEGQASAAEEEEEDTVSTVTPDDHQKMDNTVTKIQGKKEDSEMQNDQGHVDFEVKLHTVTELGPEEEDNVHRVDTGVQSGDGVTVATLEEAENGGGPFQLTCENKKPDEGIVANQLLVCKELPGVSEDEQTKQELVMTQKSDEAEDQSEHGAVIEEEDFNEATNTQTIDEVKEQEYQITAGTEEEKNILTECVARSEEAVQSAETWLHTAEFTDKEEEDVVVTEVQTEIDVMITDFSVDKDPVEEEKLSSEVDNKESFVEILCTTTSDTVKPKGETGWEISKDFKNIPPGIGEGQAVVLKELNTPTCEEAQEGVPEYNNELGPDENTTQWFLEGGDSEEIEIAQLPEEVESKEQESLQNSGYSRGADCLLVREPMEEKLESIEDIKNTFDLVVEEHTGILTDTGLPQETEEPLVEERLSFEKEESKLLETSMKTEIKHLEKEFETHVASAGETDETTKELQKVTKELLVEFGLDEGESKEVAAVGDFCEMKGAQADETLKFLDAEVQKMTEASFFQESIQTINLEQNSNKSPSLLEDFTGFGFFKYPEHKLPDDSHAEMQDAGIDMDERDYGNDEETEQEMLNKNNIETLHLQAAGMAAEQITENKEKAVAEAELSEHCETQETENQSPNRAVEISEKDVITDTEAAEESKITESKPKDWPVFSVEGTAKQVTEPEGSCTEQTRSSISGYQDVIDEEILDLWLETATSEDTDGVKQQEGPEPGQLMDTKINLLNEEQGEISSEKENKRLIESNSGELGSVSDTEMSSSTVESGFLDQSQSSDAQLLKSTSTCSLEGINDILAAGMSEFSTQQSVSESQNLLMEETADTVQSFQEEEESITDSGFPSPVAGNLNQEPDESQEKTDEERVESAESETGSQGETEAEVRDISGTTDKDTEEADVVSLTKILVPFQVEKPKPEDEHPEITPSDSLDKIKHTESGQSGNDSEASLEEEVVLTEPDSQGDTWTESEKMLSSLNAAQPRCSQEIPESLLELNRTVEEVEKRMMRSDDQNEVDGVVLDFTLQRSRIAVKNPRVRPPKDPRSLLNMPSVDPTPSSHVPVKVPVGVPLGGLGIGIKLPGLGAGFPVLKKTQRVVRDESSQETPSQEGETKSDEKSDTPQQDEAQYKPKWMPPRHPGFGNPLMSELKTKLKKTTKE